MESAHSVNESSTTYKCLISILKLISKVFTWMRWFSVHSIVSASPIRSEECLLLGSPQFRESTSLSIKGWNTYN